MDLREYSLINRHQIELSGRFSKCFGIKTGGKKYLYKFVNYLGIIFFCNLIRKLFNNNKISVNNIDYFYDGKKESSLKILHLSDLHFDNKTYKLDDLIEVIGINKIDLVFITGDFYDKYNGDNTNIELLYKCLQYLNLKFAPIVTLGNHDPCELISALEKIGYRVLLNESIFLEINDINLAITGIDDTSHFYSKYSLRCALNSISQFNILAAHTPELADFFSKKGYNLYLCGHTHGGQINLTKNLVLFKGISRNKKLFKGHWKLNQMNGYTSVGVGCSLLPLRVNVPPEIVIHSIYIG